MEAHVYTFLDAFYCGYFQFRFPLRVDYGLWGM